MQKRNNQAEATQEEDTSAEPDFESLWVEVSISNFTRKIKHSRDY